MASRYAALKLLPVLLASLFHWTGAGALPSQKIQASVLGMPLDPWPFVRQGPKGPETYLIPADLDKVRRLPEPERSRSLETIKAHQANLSTLRKTMGAFFPRLRSGHLQASPEYTFTLDEVVMEVDWENAREHNPIQAHEPVLQALPPYSRVILLAPEQSLRQVRKRLEALGLGEKVRVVANRVASDTPSSDGVTRWVRDLMLVVRDDSGATLLTSLAHKNYQEVFDNDLEYLNRIAGPRRHVLRAPIFLRGGNLLVAARAGRRILLVGRDELAMNRQWFVKTFNFTPPPNAVPDILKAATGVDDLIIVPNSQSLFHLDMFIAPLADDTVGILAPQDPEAMAAADRDILAQARTLLQRAGFRIVDIPTAVKWMKNFQSPANVVPFVDRDTGRRRVLLPVFEEPGGDGPSQGLNARVAAAYRSAGLDPIPVKDIFHLRRGSIHCTLVPLR